MVCAYILFLFIFLCREAYYRKEGTIFFSHMLSCITKNEKDKNFRTKLFKNNKFACKLCKNN